MASGALELGADLDQLSAAGRTGRAWWLFAVVVLIFHNRRQVLQPMLERIQPHDSNAEAGRQWQVSS
jgi:hypothetical protein